ncbi:MAG: prephenate dehydrogenase [Anaerolineae bacterium]|nr:prephenate dehydrogenase [Anaerolineae bacterium]MDH7473767.1 prephenate dehydrogenase [Anaerolineae bacterium]
MKKLADAQVTIVGLGLMGSSLAGALRGRCRAVVGVGRRAETIEAALARGLIDQGTTDLASGVRRADVVVLATPVRVILRLLSEIGPLLPAGCLLMDVGSTKVQIVARMADLPSHVQPLGGHPMCGKEIAGIAAADPTLYQDHVFILTPLPRTSETALALGLALVKAVGARPLLLDPERHDRLVAAISHLPYLLACALVGTAEAMASADPLVWEIAASGFRDTSRLAASDVTMMLDILLTNKQAVLEAVSTCTAQLCRLARLMETGDEEGLQTVLSSLRDSREAHIGAVTHET